MALNNGFYSLNVDEIGPYYRDVVHVVLTGCNCVGLPLILVVLRRVGSLTDPLHISNLIHDVAPLNDHIPVGSLCLLVFVRRGNPLYRHHDDSLAIVAMVLHEMEPYVVNGFVLRPEMLDRLHNLLPLVRYVRPLSSAYLEMPFHYRLDTEIRQ